MRTTCWCFNQHRQNSCFLFEHTSIWREQWLQIELCPARRHFDPCYSPSSEDSSASSNHRINFWSCWKTRKQSCQIFCMTEIFDDEGRKVKLIIILELNVRASMWTNETYPLVLPELPAFVCRGSLREPAQNHLLLQDLQLVQVHQDLQYKHIHPHRPGGDKETCTRLWQTPV